MKDTTVAARYARALFIVSERRKETAAALADLKSVAGILAPGSGAARLFASPEVRLPDKRELLRGIEAQARQRIQQAVTEGQKVAAEIKAQAHVEAQQRVARAGDEIEREREKAKELLKEHIISLAVRSAEKILRENLDDKAQRKLAAEFIDEVGATR